jgi:hypothetical protein
MVFRPGSDIQRAENIVRAEEAAAQSVATVSPSASALSAVRTPPLEPGPSKFVGRFRWRSTLVEQLIPGAAAMRLITGLANKVLDISGIEPESSART